VIISNRSTENYGPDCILSGRDAGGGAAGSGPTGISIRPLAPGLHAKTRAIIIHTPHNPTGKVYRRDELAFIAGLCQGVRRAGDHRRRSTSILSTPGEHKSSIAMLERHARSAPSTIRSLEDILLSYGWRLGLRHPAPAE